MPSLPAILFLIFSVGMISRPASAAEPLECIVISVHDGDSMRVKCPGDRRNQRLRMTQIDAPELEQAYGRNARDFLRKLCPKGAAATIRTEGEDQYGRLLGDVYCNGKSVNEHMLRSGSAWVYDRHAKDRKLYQWQNLARSQKRGLWADKHPEAPWRWRHTRQRNR